MYNILYFRSNNISLGGYYSYSLTHGKKLSFTWTNTGSIPTTHCCWSVSNITMVKFKNQGTKYYDVKVCPQTNVYTMCNGEYWFCFGMYNKLMSSKFKINSGNSNKEISPCDSVFATMNANISCKHSILTSMEINMISMTSTAVPSAETSSSICSTESSMTSLTSTISTETSLASITPIETSMTSLASIMPIETSMTSLASIMPTEASMTSIDIISTPSPTPINCSTDGIWPETLPGHNVTGFYCYKGTVNGK